MPHLNEKGGNPGKDGLMVLIAKHGKRPGSSMEDGESEENGDPESGMVLEKLSEGMFEAAENKDAKKHADLLSEFISIYSKSGR